jgi:hypothetical protein
MVYGLGSGLPHVHVACRGSFGLSRQKLSVSHTKRTQVADG